MKTTSHRPQNHTLSVAPQHITPLIGHPVKNTNATSLAIRYVFEPSARNLVQVQTLLDIGIGRPAVRDFPERSALLNAVYDVCFLGQTVSEASRRHHVKPLYLVNVMKRTVEISPREAITYLTKAKESYISSDKANLHVKRVPPSLHRQPTTTLDALTPAPFASKRVAQAATGSTPFAPALPSADIQPFFEGGSALELAAMGLHVDWDPAYVSLQKYHVYTHPNTDFSQWGYTPAPDPTSGMPAYWGPTSYPSDTPASYPTRVESEAFGAGRDADALAILFDDDPEALLIPSMQTIRELAPSFPHDNMVIVSSRALAATHREFFLVGQVFAHRVNEKKKALFFTMMDVCQGSSVTAAAEHYCVPADAVASLMDCLSSASPIDVCQWLQQPISDPPSPPVGLGAKVCIFDGPQSESVPMLSLQRFEPHALTFAHHPFDVGANPSWMGNHVGAQRMPRW